MDIIKRIVITYEGDVIDLTEQKDSGPYLSQHPLRCKDGGGDILIEIERGGYATFLSGSVTVYTDSGKDFREHLWTPKQMEELKKLLQ